MEVIHCLTHPKNLPAKYRDHAPGGNQQGFGDCHIKPGPVLIYAIGDDYVQLARLGSHAELF
ncbi:type II toxin-antitoxin system YafQ family toxin [uncultured Cardiobacterium sp.]|uniref:type II toxin-antitoxin system YafQ family toxin n=1 Tax=uncultured Cardiobacterium sp. TaxID=417619 RepID=UPI0034297D3D